jgi:hypothetical protein
LSRLFSPLFSVCRAASGHDGVLPHTF